MSRTTSLPIHKLRYIEKSDSKIKITKIRERRYYTGQDIDYIKKHYCAVRGSSQSLSPDFENNKFMIAKIDALIGRFRTVSNDSY